jgi:hypothetical protein
MWKVKKIYLFQSTPPKDFKNNTHTHSADSE